MGRLFERYAMPKKNKNWDTKKTVSKNPDQDLNHLILGHGRIGQLLESQLQAMGAEVQVFDPFKERYALDLTQTVWSWWQPAK